MLELPTTPPEARPFSLAAEDTPGTEVFVAGYGGDYVVGLSSQPELRYSISTLVPPGDSIARSIRWRSAEGADNGGCLGDSGGPILVRRSDQSFALLGIHYGIDTTDHAELCRNWGVAGKLVAEGEWLNDALHKLSVSRRRSGPPRPRRDRFRATYLLTVRYADGSTAAVSATSAQRTEPLGLYPLD